MKCSEYIRRHGASLGGKLLLYLGNYDTMAQAWDACNDIDILDDLIIDVGHNADIAAKHKALMLRLIGKYTIPKDWRGDYIREWLKTPTAEHVVLVAMMFVSNMKDIGNEHAFILENIKQCGNPYAV